MIAVLVLAVACGDNDENVPTPSPTQDTRANAKDWSVQYMQLGQARKLLVDLGLEGVSLAPTAYECIQQECPDQPPGDDSWGCLHVLPIGDPANAESLYPDDPPGWYSAYWTGGFRETYSAPPERVVNAPSAELDQRQDVACGVGFGLETTAQEATDFLEESGLSEIWNFQSGPPPTCTPGAVCPIPGVAADTTGCLSVSIFDQAKIGPQGEPRVTIWVGWRSSGGDDFPDGLSLNYSINRTVSEFEAVASSMDDGSCFDSPAPDPDPYDWVPYTNILQSTYWTIEEAPSGAILVLRVAVGGNCEEFERLDVVETEEAVTISATIRHSTPGPNSACDEYLAWHEATVELSQPLGDRELLGCAPEEIWYVDHEKDCAEPGD